MLFQRVAFRVESVESRINRAVKIARNVYFTVRIGTVFETKDENCVDTGTRETNLLHTST